MKKSLGFYYAIASAALALVSLVTFFVYTGNGGEANALVILALIGGIGCEVSLCFGEKPYTDYAGIVGAALVAFAFITVLSGGVGNIADAVNGIVMFGKAELAIMNYTMAVLSFLSVIAAILACFSKKSKA